MSWFPLLLLLLLIFFTDIRTSVSRLSLLTKDQRLFQKLTDFEHQIRTSEAEDDPEQSKHQDLTKTNGNKKGHHASMLCLPQKHSAAHNRPILERQKYITP